MTKNQIEYWRNVETAQHNRELERQGVLALEETKRANLANERLAASAQAETHRSNVARENETARYNLANNQYDLLRLDETKRANLVNESISAYNAESGRIQAHASATSAGAAASQAYTAEQRRLNDYGLRDYQNKETVRHNATTEGIQSNSNPWVSIATTLNKLIPRVADTISSQIVTPLRSYTAPKPKTPTTVAPVSSSLLSQTKGGTNVKTSTSKQTTAKTITSRKTGAQR